MTTYDATMNVMIWIHVFPSRSFKIHLYLQDYLTHEGVNSHMASVLVYLFTSLLSTVRTQL